MLVDRTTAYPAITVGFRGTTASANWAIDYDVRQIPAAPYFGNGTAANNNNTASNSNTANNDNNNNNNNNNNSALGNGTVVPMLVHEGYQISYDHLRPGLLAAVTQLCHLGLYGKLYFIYFGPIPQPPCDLPRALCGRVAVALMLIGC